MSKKKKQSLLEIFNSLHDLNPDKAVLVFVMDTAYPEKAEVVHTGTWSYLPFISALVKLEMDSEYDDMDGLEE